jgi:hypothetical protein
LPEKDKTLLIGRNAFFILNLGFHIVNGVRPFNLKRNGQVLTIFAYRHEDGGRDGELSQNSIFGCHAVSRVMMSVTVNECENKFKQ